MCLADSCVMVIVFSGLNCQLSEKGPLKQPLMSSRKDRQPLENTYSYLMLNKYICLFIFCHFKSVGRRERMGHNTCKCMRGV